MYKLFSWPTIIIYSFCIFIFSVIPLRIPEQLAFPFFDKLFHSLIYTLLSFLVLNTAGRTKKKYPRFFGFSYAFAFGFSIEIIQLFLPFRNFELIDIVSNFFGSLLGCLLKVM